MKKDIGTKIWYAMISLMITSCGLSHSFTQSWRAELLSEEELDELDINIGISESCLPPCWHGLIPGVSTTEEVQATLSGLETIDVHSIQYFYSEDGDMLIARWESALVDNSIYGGRLETINGILSQIEVTLEYELELGALINLLGKPDFYEFTPYGGESTALVVRFLWLDNGLLVSLPEFPPDTQIRSDMLVKRMVYSKPGDTVVDYLENKGSPARFSTSYLPWSGFEEIAPP